MAVRTGPDRLMTRAWQAPLRLTEQDAPLVATEAELRNINLVTVVLLPFGVLAIGIFVWWRNRERETAR